MLTILNVVVRHSILIRVQLRLAYQLLYVGLKIVIGRVCVSSCVTLVLMLMPVLIWKMSEDLLGSIFNLLEIFFFLVYHNE